MRQLAVVVLCVVLSSCASAPKPPDIPTVDHHVAACVASCYGSKHLPDALGEDDGGWIMREQRVCRAPGRLTFEDGFIVGEALDSWLICRDFDISDRTNIRCTLAESHPKRDVHRMSCDTWVRERVASRSTSERGIHPGEDPYGKPNPPNQ